MYFSTKYGNLKTPENIESFWTLYTVLHTVGNMAVKTHKDADAEKEK